MDRSQPQWIADPVARLYYYELQGFRIYQDGRRVPLSDASLATPRVPPSPYAAGASSAPGRLTTQQSTTYTTATPPATTTSDSLRQAAGSRRIPSHQTQGAPGPAFADITRTTDRAATALGQLSLLPQKHYTKVRCLLLHWQDADPRFAMDCRKLRDQLQSHFGYKVSDPWPIPTRDSSEQLRDKLERWVALSSSHQELLIVHYSGHGGLDRSTGGLCWSQHESGSPSLYWDDIREDILFAAQQDVLLLLDCCHAAATRRGPRPGRKEALAACGSNDWTYAEPSWTSSLVRELQACLVPTTTTQIHARLLAAYEDRRRAQRLRRKPVHVPFPCLDLQPIVLRPRGSSSQLLRKVELATDAAAKPPAYEVGTQAILAVRDASGRPQRVPFQVEEARYDSGQWYNKLRGEGLYRNDVRWTQGAAQQANTIPTSRSAAAQQAQSGSKSDDDGSEEDDDEESSGESDGD